MHSVGPVIIHTHVLDEKLYSISFVQEIFPNTSSFSLFCYKSYQLSIGSSELIIYVFYLTSHTSCSTLRRIYLNLSSCHIFLAILLFPQYYFFTPLFSCLVSIVVLEYLLDALFRLWPCKYALSLFTPEQFFSFFILVSSLLVTGFPEMLGNDAFLSVLEKNETVKS